MPLPLLRRFAYASPAFFLTVAALTLYVFVPRFYSDAVGLDVATVGQLLLVARIFDAVSDPVVGWLSDRARWRAGRRRPLIFVASPLLALSVVLLLTPPAGAGAGWFAASVFAVYLFWTLVVVPYEAMGIEITEDYDERTAIMGLREGGAVVGILVALAAPPLLARAFGLPDTPEGERARFRLFALMLAPPLVLTAWGCVLALRDRPLSERTPAPGLRPFLAELRRNRPFLVLLVAFALTTLAANVSAALILYYVEHVIGAGEPELFLLVYVLAGLAGVPLWVWLARRYEKRTAWLAALGVGGAASLAMLPLGPGDGTAFGILVVLAGSPFGGLMVLPSAMQADAVDLGESLSGARREGLHVGLWNLARKVPGAVGVGASLWILGASGYEAGAEQTEGVRTALRLLYCALPGTLFALALLASLAYRLDRGRHAGIRHAIRKPRGPSQSPRPRRSS